MTIEPGKTLLHYRLLTKLGEGGMGVVWKAEDTRLGRFVALKFVPESAAQDETRVERFLREARAASALNHNNICTIYDIGEWENRHYIAMELLDGPTLRERIGGRPLELDTTVDLGVQLADALAAAHAGGIIHRDVKTTNVIVTERDQVKILDFGLAKLQRGQESQTDAEAPTATRHLDLTGEGAAVGTVAYMSPEQALGKEVDARSDVFSLGVVLYEMATGRRPFSGNTSAALFDEILNRAPTAPVELNPRVPPELESIVNRALEKDPELRYQSAADLRADLKRMQRGGASSSRSAVAAAAAAPSPGKTIPARWLALAVVGVVGLLVAAYFMLPRESVTPAGPASIRPLTGMVGVEGSPSWSPDGTFLAFDQTAPGPINLYVMPTAGGEAVPLVESEADDHVPHWSPDSRWIAFVSNRDARTGIFLVPPLGGQVQRLADTNVPFLDDGFQGAMLGTLPWSPDGRKLLFSRQHSDGSVAIWEIELDSRSETQLTRPDPGVRDISASRSFDGSRIVFARNEDLWLLTPGEAPQPLLEDEFAIQSPVWMPDGNRIIFTSNRAGNENLWEIDAASGGLRQVTTGPGSEYAPAVSRDGRIAYSLFSHQQDLYVVSLDDMSHERLTSHTRNNDSARISPDGRKIVYHSSRTGNPEIWVIDRATGNETRLTNHPALDNFPGWSPDGKEIVFISDRGGEAALWAVNADGSGGQRRLTEERVWLRTHGVLDYSTVRWSPDGAAIGFLAPSDRGPALYELDLDTGNVTPKVYGVETFGWYRDRDRVIYTPIFRDNAGRMEMRAVNLRTGDESVLLEEPHTELIVSRDGTAVAYCRAASHLTMQLYYLQLRPPAPDSQDGLPAPVGQPVQLTEGYGSYHVHNGGWSPDGKQIVYTRDVDAGDIYVIEPQDR